MKTLDADDLNMIQVAVVSAIIRLEGNNRRSKVRIKQPNSWIEKYKALQVKLDAMEDAARESNPIL